MDSFVSRLTANRINEFLVVKMFPVIEKWREDSGGLKLASNSQSSLESSNIFSTEEVII